MKVEILAAAEAELAEAVSYYNEQSEGLGYELAAEVKQTIARILQFPEAWTRLSARTRQDQAIPLRTGVSGPWRLGPYRCRDASTASPRHMEITTGIGRAIIGGEQRAAAERRFAPSAEPWRSIRKRRSSRKGAKIAKENEKWMRTR